MDAKDNKRKTRKNGERGELLLEMLVAIALLAVFVTVGVNAVYLSLRSNKAGGERDVANALAGESVEAVRALSEEDWQNIYALTKSSQHYKTIQSAAKWIVSTGDETISLNGIVYTRYITIDNVSRNSATRNIDTSYVSGNDDPSTQKVTATVSWPNGNPVVLNTYLLRAKNKTCGQTSWTTADPGNTVHVCADATYDTKDAAIDVTGGTLKLQ